MDKIVVDKSVFKLMRNIGLISNLIINKSLIKFKPDESFKFVLTKYLEDCIEALKILTLEHGVEYVEVTDVDSKIDENLCLHRLYYFVSEIISILVLNDETQMKSVEKAISGVVYYIKVICKIYDINTSKIVIDKEEYEDESIA